MNHFLNSKWQLRVIHEEYIPGSPFEEPRDRDIFLSVGWMVTSCIGKEGEYGISICFHFDSKNDDETIIAFWDSFWKMNKEKGFFEETECLLKWIDFKSGQIRNKIEKIRKEYEWYGKAK